MRQHKDIMKIFLLFFSTFILIGCTSIEKKTDLQKLSTHAIDLLQGHWTACDSNNKESILVEYVFIANKLYLYVTQLDAPNCYGYPVKYAIYKSVVEFGELGASTFVKGATDLKITPNIDLFGCGLENSSNVVLIFKGTDYSQFNIGGGSHTCNVQFKYLDQDQRLTFFKRSR